MSFYAATEYSPVDPEVVLNLWAFSDEEGYIVRISGKLYVLDGTDEDKLATLRLLSKSDFLGAGWQNVPKNFKMIDEDGQELTGVTTESTIAEPSSHSHLFGPLIEELAKSIPEQLCFAEGEYRVLQPELPQNPLTVTTIVREKGDGQLVPLLSRR